MLFGEKGTVTTNKSNLNIREALLDIEEYCDLVIHIDQETTIEDVVSEIERNSSEWKSE